MLSIYLLKRKMHSFYSRFCAFLGYGQGAWVLMVAIILALSWLTASERYEKSSEKQYTRNPANSSIVGEFPGSH